MKAPCWWGRTGPCGEHGGTARPRPEGTAQRPWGQRAWSAVSLSLSLSLFLSLSLSSFSSLSPSPQGPGAADLCQQSYQWLKVHRVRSGCAWWQTGGARNWCWGCWCRGALRSFSTPWASSVPAVLPNPGTKPRPTPLSAPGDAAGSQGMASAEFPGRGRGSPRAPRPHHAALSSSARGPGCRCRCPGCRAARCARSRG